MNKTKPLFKKMWMLLAFLFCSVVSANAATITYSLTTHVDGRTMTATADVAAGADLLSSMPQSLWRAYCTYSFTDEAGETITTAPANGGTVYVDYEFDPPFTVSEDGQEPVWHYLKHEPGVGQKFYYYSEYHGKLDQKYGNDLPFEQTENVRMTGSQTLKTRENAQWAFYGDAYCLNLKFNDVNNIESNDFMVCQITSRTFFGRTTYTYKVKTGAKMMPGWQLYVNDALNGSFSLGLPEDIHINQLLYLYDLGDSGQVKDLSTERDAGRSSKNHITNTDSQGQGWDECLCYAFMATPASDPPGSLNPWRVTYKIQKADGTWYADIIEQKTADNLTPSFPPAGFNPNPECEYDCFYLDKNFNEKCPEGYTMPADGNTVLYVKEIEKEPEPLTVTYKIIMAYQNNEQRGDDIVEDNEGQIPALNEQYKLADTDQYTYTYSYFKDAELTKEYTEGETVNPEENVIVYVKEDRTEIVIPEPPFQRTFTEGKWMTLVLPDYSLLEQNSIWGRFLDYVAVESHENAEDGYHWNCDLKFKEVDYDKLVPNRPYLFLPEKIEGADDARSKVVTFSLNGTPEVVSHVDPTQPDVTISMYGTYEDFELVPCEPQEPKGYKYIYFYFGNPAEGEYNFYTVENPVTIKPTICYFDIKATKNAQNAPTIGGFGAKFSFFEGTNAINNIEGVKTGADKVYNLNGQQVQGNLQKGIYIVNGKKVLVK